MSDAAMHFVQTVPITTLSTKERLLQNKEFLVMLAHELRNPLAPIFNALHLIEQNSGENILLKNSQRVLARQIKHMTGTIDNLLDIARLAENKLVMHPEEIDLATIINRAVEASRSLMDSRRHTLNISLPDETVWLNADPGRIQQIVQSLLSNAAKFTESGGKITIAADHQQGGDNCTIIVRDNGVGISKDAIPHIFELFTQADHSMHISQGGGLGIGLTLVRALVEMHGGHVEAYSGGTNKGSEFVVCLPVIRIGGTPDPVYRDEPVRSRKSLEILVVDDHIDTAESTGIILRTMGHRVRIAHSGPAALHQAQVYNPDVVLLDIGLPGMDGYQVAKEIRKEFPETLLIAITGYGQDIDKKRSQLAGCDHHLVKPVNPKVFPHILHKKEAVKVS